jgi:YVTN family beta-propeller protein
VTNLNSDSISVIDTQSKTRIGDIPTGKGPVRIRVTPDGKTLIYALQTGEAVGFANAETRKEETQVKLTGQPVSLTFSKDNQYAFSAVQSQDKIFVIRYERTKSKGSSPRRQVRARIPTCPSGRAPLRRTRPRRRYAERTPAPN